MTETFHTYNLCLYPARFLPLCLCPPLCHNLSLSRALIIQLLADAWLQAGTGAGAVETLPAPATAQAAAPGLQLFIT